MIHIHSLRDGLPLFKALGSETRIAILELLIEKGPMRMTKIAQELQITGGALTTHVRMLNEAGILLIQTKGGRHGIQKVCSVNNERILIEAPMRTQGQQVYEADIDIGQFLDCEASAPCGIATTDRQLRPHGDPSSFSDPERLRAGVLWLSKGFVEYAVPSFVKAGQKLTKLELALEVAAGAPKDTGDETTDLHLMLNERELGTITLKPSRDNMVGKANPAWWSSDYRQRGGTHLVTVDATGTYVDGERLSNTTLDDLDISGKRSMPLRIATVPGKPGFTLFGRGFGGQAYGIRVRSHYKTNKKTEKSSEEK